MFDGEYFIILLLIICRCSLKLSAVLKRTLCYNSHTAFVSKVFITVNVNIPEILYFCLILVFKQQNLFKLAFTDDNFINVSVIEMYRY